MTKLIYSCILGMAVLFTSSYSAMSASNSLQFYRKPAISPDGKKVAFVYAGDLYLCSSSGGEAIRITSDPGYDSHPDFSPDGTKLAFTSWRSGSGDVYTIDLESQEITQLTFHESEDIVEDWHSEGEYILFSSSRSDISGYTDLFRVNTSGSTPMLVSGDQYEHEYNASVSPDGSTILLNVNDRTRQWWRKGRRFNDLPQIWQKNITSLKHDYLQVIDIDSRCLWPQWYNEGSNILFVSDRDSENGILNLYSDVELTSEQAITSFVNGYVAWPDVSNDGDIVFERNFSIWLKVPNREARQIPIIKVLHNSSEDSIKVTHQDGFTEFTLSPDGTKVAFILRGEIFIQSIINPQGEFAGEAIRITNTSAPEYGIVWTPNNNDLFYLTQRSGKAEIWKTTLDSGLEQLVIAEEDNLSNPLIDPTGRYLVYQQGTNAIVIRDIEKNTVSNIIYQTVLYGSYAFSPDGEHLAFESSDNNLFYNVSIISCTEDEPPIRLTDSPNIVPGALAWSSDGKYIVSGNYLDRTRRNITKIELLKTNSINFNFIDTSNLTYRITYPSSLSRATSLIGLSPDSKSVFTVSKDDAGNGIWISALSDENRAGPRKLTKCGRPTHAAITNDGMYLWYLDRGKISIIALKTRIKTNFDPPIEFFVVRSSDNEATVIEAWNSLKDYCWDYSTYKDEWRGLLEYYLPYFRDIRTVRGFNLLANYLVGELNTSHIRLEKSDGSDFKKSRELGIIFSAKKYIADKTLVVESVIPNSPANRVGISNGDILLEINNVELTASSNINSSLLGDIDSLIQLRYSTGSGLSKSIKSVKLRGINSRSIENLRYKHWVDQNEQIVSKLSNDNLAYIHFRHFGTGVHNHVLRKIKASDYNRSGIVIDIRNNGGGWASVEVIDMLSRMPQSKSTFQDGTKVDNSMLHSVFVFGLPSILLQNEQCLSDAENFSESYRQKSLGTIVGTNTAGWNMASNGFTLFNGTRLGVPVYRPETLDGVPKDKIGRRVDIEVERPIGESQIGRDSQLEKAVQVLLIELDDKR